MYMQILEYNKDSISKVAEKLLITYGTDYKIWALRGEMGSGKTTLIAALLEAMGYQGSVSSPTFAIVQEYPIPEDTEVYHMDWYRVNSVEELWEIGIDEYLGNNSLKLIEWPDIYLDEIKNEALLIDFTTIDDDTRQLKIGQYEES